jgi:hypothetical protein
MLDSATRYWINEAMSVDRAAAIEGTRQHFEALETEFRPALAANHLVAFLALAILILDVLLRHRALALWTLLRSCPLHPPSELLFFVAMSGRSLGLRVFLARHSTMVRSCRTM